MNVRPGDVLLYAVSAERDVAWDRFKRIVDAMCAPDNRLANEMKHVRTEAVEVGSMLGHWDAVHTGTDRRIAVAPPVLARLPWPGLPRAVLCGSRSPDTIGEVREVCASFNGLSLSASAQIHHPYAPMRLEISGESEEQLIAAGSELSVCYDPNPAAWAIAQASGTVEGYLEALAWEEREDLNWDRREFNPELLRFGTPTDVADSRRLRLFAYSHPSGWDWRDWLWDGSASADADRSWGRYCVLASVGRSVLCYDRREGVAIVPRQVPLPKLLARALTLSSGEAPELVPGSGIGRRAYSSVPYAIFEAVAGKLHQDQPRRLSPAIHEKRVTDIAATELSHDRPRFLHDKYRPRFLSNDEGMQT